MVFPGRFSSGCRRCRQRKVKCDEGKPSCRRCYMYGKPCTGYTDQFHFRFEKPPSKQDSASPPQQRRERTQVSCQRPPQSERNSSDNAVVQNRKGSPAILPHLELSCDHVSLCYFVSRFVTPDEADSFPGHLSFLPVLYSHHGSGLLEVATLSVAQMAVYNRFGGDEFRLQSYRNYGLAVRTLRQTIQTEEEVTDDRVITAVLLLCMFKDISGEGEADLTEHASGLYYLLEKRGMEQLCTKRGIELHFLALLRLQAHSYLNQDDSYSDPGGYVAWLSRFDPMMRAMSLMTRGLRLRHSLSKCGTALDKDRKPGEEAPRSEHQRDSNETDASILYACFEALEEFDSWDLDAESYWKDTFEGRSVPAALGKVATKTTYYDPETACTIILVRSARLALLSSILEYYDALRPSSGDGGAGGISYKAAWADCVPALKDYIRLTVDDLLWCVPFAMGDLDSDGNSASMLHDGAAALIIHQPLKLVTHCPYATPEQKKSGQSILNRMGSAIGVRSALLCSHRRSHLGAITARKSGRVSCHGLADNSWNSVSPDNVLAS